MKNLQKGFIITVLLFLLGICAVIIVVYIYQNKKISIQKSLSGNYGIVSDQAKSNCPKETLEILQRAKLNIKDKLSCALSQTVNFKGNVAEIYSVIYGFTFQGDMRIPLIANVLKLPDGELEVLSNGLLDKGNAHEYLSSLFNMPFGGWTNFTVDDFAEKQELIMAGQKYCFSYTMKYPFIGILQQCEDSISGSITYATGIISWSEALKKLDQECQKYGKILCKSKIRGTPTSFYEWSGPVGNSVLKIGNQNNIGSSYYLFVEGTYENGTGKEDNIITRVYLNGDVNSQLVPRDNYDKNKLLQY